MHSLTNRTFYRKFNFNELVANLLHDNTSMIIFDLQGCGGCQRPKTSSLTQCLVHPTAPVLLTKDSPRNKISYDFQHSLSLHIFNSRTKPAGLDFQWVGMGIAIGNFMLTTLCKLHCVLGRQKESSWHTVRIGIEHRKAIPGWQNFLQICIPNPDSV